MRVALGGLGRASRGWHALRRGRNCCRHGLVVGMGLSHCDFIVFVFLRESMNRLYLRVRRRGAVTSQGTPVALGCSGAV